MSWVSVKKIARDRQGQPLGYGCKHARLFDIFLQSVAKLDSIDRSDCHVVRRMESIAGERLADGQDVAQKWRQGKQ